MNTIDLLQNHQLQHDCRNKVYQIENGLLKIVVSKPMLGKPVETIECSADDVNHIRIYDISNWKILSAVLGGLLFFIASNIYSYYESGSLMLSILPLFGVILFFQCLTTRRWRVDFVTDKQIFFWQSQVFIQKYNKREYSAILDWAEESGIDVVNERKSKQGASE